MSYTLKKTVINEYLGDNKINYNMQATLVEEYNKNKLYQIPGCDEIIAKAMRARSVKQFFKYIEDLEDLEHKHGIAIHFSIIV